MNNKIEELLEKWEEGSANSRYSQEQTRDIAINCVSLSNTWFQNNRPTEKESYEVRLYSDDVVAETFHGVTADNLPETMMKIITNNNGKYNMLTLNSYIFKDGAKKDIRVLGVMDL